MRRKILVPIVVVSLLCGALFYAASGHNYHYAVDYDALFAAPETKSAERHMVDMIADDSYLIEQGDSTVFILVGNFAAHHNGTVILADSAIRYPNQSFECFGNVLINQNETYAYGDRAHYDRANSTATIYSELVKVVDGDAVMYTYNCMFDTADEVGIFYDGCYVRKGESHLEAERGYYNTQTHDLIAVDNVEMRDEKYLMTGDSVIFNTQTEDAQYFTNTNIWNEKDEYLFANAGNYAKAEDLYHLTRDAYMLSEEREVWSDTIEYYRTTGHIVGRSNIQMDDTTQKILGFADYGEWWDDLDNALFTRRPSMINYNPDEPDSIYLCADTLWLYTIPVLPPSADTTSNSAAREADKERGDRDSMPDMQDSTMREDIDNVVEESNDESEAMKPSNDLSEVLGDDENLNKRENNVEKSTGVAEKSSGKSDAQKPSKDLSEMLGEDGNLNKREEHDRKRQTKRGEEFKRDLGTIPGEDTMLNDSQRTEPREDEVDSVATDSLSSTIVSVADTLITDSIRLDSTAVDTLSKDSVKVLTPRQIRYRAKMERRRVRDSIRTMERIVQDSLDSIKQREMDSIQHIRDSLLKIEIDSLIAKRRARSAQLADEEKARLERVKQKTEERNRRKIDKAKARALKRGKVYTGPDYVIDSVATDSLAVDSVAVDSIVGEERDTMLADTLATDSLGLDSLGRDSIDMLPPFPDDSVYKMIKAYRRVKMYRSDSQMVCDSMTMLNTDSIIRLYIEPVMWNEDNQITSDSMAIHTRNEVITKAHFMGNPMMGMEIDTMYYNQVAGKDMTAYFADGEVYRNDVDGNAQTIYYMQEEDSPEVTGLMYIESASISFYLVESEIDKIAYKQNPTYVLYPMNMIPETQDLKLKDFNWYYERRPLRDSIFNRSIRPTQRDNVASRQKPRFRITERIDYDRRRLVENRMWEDRVDQLTPEVIEWRNTRATYPNK